MMENLMTRFLSKINKIEKGCWIWQAAKDVNGYGCLAIEGKKERAHRVSYKLFIGNIKDIENSDYRGACVIHSCDNRACVNPSHLRIGTHQDNMNDKSIRKRFVSNPLLGEKHQNSKLKNNDISDIRVLKGYGLSPTQLAEIYGVTRSTIHSLLNFETWKHI